MDTVLWLIGWGGFCVSFFMVLYRGLSFIYYTFTEQGQCEYFWLWYLSQRSTVYTLPNNNPIPALLCVVVFGTFIHIFL